MDEMDFDKEISTINGLDHLASDEEKKNMFLGRIAPRCLKKKRTFYN